MKQRRFVLIFGIETSLTEGLLADLKSQGYRCIKSTKANEVEQVGKQFGRVAILFFDHKFAVNFLRESDFSTFHKYRVVFFEKRPVMTPKVSWIFDELFLKNYYTQTKEQFFEDLDEFFSAEDPDKPIEDIDSIEFAETSVQDPFRRKKNV
jgi:hypothetical protein